MNKIDGRNNIYTLEYILKNGSSLIYTGTLNGSTSYELSLPLTQFCLISIVLIQGIIATEVVIAVTINYVAYSFDTILKKTLGTAFLDGITRTSSGKLTITTKNTNSFTYEIKILPLKDVPV
jgi:hypothetical protein